MTKEAPKMPKETVVCMDGLAAWAASSGGPRGEICALHVAK
jgi:hypothetical protein